MALDGITLGIVKEEIKSLVLGAKVEKIHQPSKNELVFIFRTRNGAYRVYFSCDPQSPRVQLTSFAPENPKTPPMLCMLFRKLLVGATLTDIKQSGNDRILFFEFSGTNEIGDKASYRLICEIMGQRSNLILCDGNNRIFDAVKRIDESKSSVREILPTLLYELPPKQEKLDIFTENPSEIVDAVAGESLMLSKALMEKIEGISPIVAREIAYRTVFGDKSCMDLSSIEKERLAEEIEKIKADAISKNSFCMLLKDDKLPFDFSFTDIRQYGNALKKCSYETCCELLDDFYFEKDRQLRIRRRAGDLLKILNSAVERASRKVNNRRAELLKSENREQLKIYAELITANQYRLTEKASEYVLENYYDQNKPITVPANPALTAQQNAQRYYKEYKKAVNAEKMLHDLIKEGEQEIIYLDSVLDTLTRAETEREISEIRSELIAGGYLKHKKTGKAKSEKPLPPLQFTTSDGFTVLVGRNNVQNDRLTLKTAKNYDMWLHVQKVAGSHTVIVSDNREITETALREAAMIAAFHSKAAQSSSVAVDYTLVKNVKKPSGAKPGRVIYTSYKTIYVTPDGETVKSLTRKE